MAEKTKTKGKKQHHAALFMKDEISDFLHSKSYLICLNLQARKRT